MKKHFFIFCVSILLLLSGCAIHQTENTIIQTSTIDALLAGVYDGQMSCTRLMDARNLGNRHL